MLSSDIKQWMIYGVLAITAVQRIAAIFPPIRWRSTHRTHWFWASIADVPSGDENIAMEDDTEGATRMDCCSFRSHHSLSRTFANKGIDMQMLWALLFLARSCGNSFGKDIQKGDRVEVVYKIGEDGHPKYASLVYSLKLGRTLTAFQWQAPQDKFSSYWAYDGTEFSID